MRRNARAFTNERRSSYHASPSPTTCLRPSSACSPRLQMNCSESPNSWARSTGLFPLPGEEPHPLSL